jgi:mannose-P-dolichol utilization defect protein 1
LIYVSAAKSSNPQTTRLIIVISNHTITADMDALRSVLQPITHNLPKPVEDLGKSLITPACYKTLLLDIDPSHTECLKLAISKGLGIGIIGASSIVKVPQLLKLINSQSAEGLSFLSYLLESGAYLISLSYNVRHGFPFSTYGETALILIQNIAIASLVLKYSGNSLGIAGWIGGLIAAGSALFNEQWVGDERLSLLQATAGVLGVASKVPQILTIWTEGGTGQLSAFAVSSHILLISRRRMNANDVGQVVNYLLGSLTRIFTTLQEVDDPLILYGFIAGFALNLILFLQVVYYWNAPASKNTESKKLEKPIAGDRKEMARAVSSGSTPSYANVAGKSPSTRRRG